MLENLDLSNLFWFMVSTLFSIFLAARFLKWHTKYYLGLLIIFTTLTAITAFDLITGEKLGYKLLRLAKFFPGGYTVGVAFFLIVTALFFLFILAFIFYPDIKKLLHHQKKRVK